MKSTSLCLRYLILWTPLLLHFSSLINCDNTCSTNTTTSTCSSYTTTTSNLKTIYHPLLSHGNNIIFDHLYPSVHFKHEFDDDHAQGFIYTYYNYEQTYDGKKKIAPALFGNSSLTFQGSQVKSPDLEDKTKIANSTSVLADYFGWSTNSNFTLHFSPEIINQTVAFRAGFKHKHFWMDVNLPFMQTNWKLTNEKNNWAYTEIPTDNLQVEKIKSMPAGNADYPGTNAVNSALINSFGEDLINGFIFNDSPADFNNNTTLDAAYMSSIVDNVGNFFEIPENDTDYQITGENYISGETIWKPSVNSLSLIDGLDGRNFGDTEQRINSLFPQNPMCNKLSGLADLHIRAGIDCYSCDSTEAKIYAKLVIPTGTELNNEYMETIFNPIIGNGHHYELGGGFNLKYEHCICDDSSASLVIDAYATHLFKTKTTRIFDLNDKPLSRFALLKQLQYFPDNATEDNGTVLKGETENALDFPIYAYTQNLIPVCNKNIIIADSYVNIYGEALLSILYTRKNWTCGIGYVFTGKTEEKYCNQETTVVDPYYYGLKGISGLNKIGLKVDSDKISNLVLRQNNDIDIKSDMFTYATDINAKDGYEADQNISSLLRMPSVNQSGFTGAQIVHKFFGSIEYLWAESSYLPLFKITSSISYSPCNYRTASTWSLGGLFGCSF
jgi:hypothetical protein